MKLRQILIILGVGLLIGTFWLANWMGNLKKKPEKKEQKTSVRKVPVTSFEQMNYHAEVPVTGRLNPSRKVELFAEVSGVLKTGDKPFKEGVRFRKGETLVTMDDRENRMNLRAQKSNFLNSITNLLPDLKMDFPDAYEKWKQYLDKLEVDAPLPPLPQIQEKQVKYFVSSQNLFNQFYSIQSQEVRLQKFTLEAPFSGVLTQSNIDPGTLVRSGQKLGEFIDPTDYELVASVDVQEIDKVEVGDTVRVSSSEIKGKWKGTVNRINHALDAGTQTINVFIRIQDEKLRGGMYMDGTIQGTLLKNTVEVPRKMLVDDSFIWVVQNDQLKKQKLDILHKLPKKVLAKGVPEKMEVLEQPFPGAFEGMPVTGVFTEDDKGMQNQEN